VEASAWCESVYGVGRLYRLQVDNVTGRSLKKIEKVCETWNSAGYGWHPKTNYKILMFVKKFSTQEDWLEWAEQFPYKLVELNSKGNPKPTKLGADYANKKHRKTKRKRLEACKEAREEGTVDRRS